MGVGEGKEQARAGPAARKGETRWLALLAFALLAFTVTSCGYPKWASRDRPEPLPSEREYPRPELKPELKPEIAAEAAGGETIADGRVVVKEGDTLHAIARRAEVPLRDLIDANGLAPPYTLLVGQVLFLPERRYHRVVAGDTVYGISRRYGIDMSTLVRLNGIAPPYTLKTGEDLRLPGRTREPVPSEIVEAELEAPGISDTGIPSEPMLSPEEIPALPDLPPPPPGDGFMWPAEGTVISGYGPKPGNRHNDGINIALPRGAPVRATRDGVIAYVGNELRGYGNLILIRHEGGWVSAYAHNDALLVGQGEKVRRGQVVALSGSTGGVATPQLHFELRRDGVSVDPLIQLAGR